MSALTKTYKTHQAQVTQNFLQMNTKIEWSAFPLRLPQSNDPSFAAGLALLLSFIVLLGKVSFLASDITESVSFSWKIAVIILVSVLYAFK